MATGNDFSDFKNNLISNYFDSKMLFDIKNKNLLIDCIKTDERLRYIFERSYRGCRNVIKEYKVVIEQNQKLITVIDEDLK